MCNDMYMYEEICMCDNLSKVIHTVTYKLHARTNVLQ